MTVVSPSRLARDDLPTSVPTLDDPDRDIVRVVLGTPSIIQADPTRPPITAPLEVMWDSRVYLLKPGEDCFMPAACAFSWFGDPRSSAKMGSIRNDKGIVAFIPDRDTERRRLRIKYDNQFGNENEIVNHPNVEVYTLKGERIPTVLDDPLGETTTIYTPTEMQGNKLEFIVQKQQETIDLLMKKLGLTSDQLADEVAPVPELDQPPEDTTVGGPALPPDTPAPLDSWNQLPTDAHDTPDTPEENA